jgi:hypothetical protein
VWNDDLKEAGSCSNPKLTTPEGKELEFVTEPVVTAKGVANRVKLNQLNASQGDLRC